MPIASDLETVARRVIWFEEPHEALADPHHFLCYLMQNGTDQDVITSYRYFSEDDFRAALKNAPAGILDGPSWAYWNLMLNQDPEQPMPQRFKDDI